MHVFFVTEHKNHLIQVKYIKEVHYKAINLSKCIENLEID